MALFIVRIELQGSPTQAVYDELHERMRFLGVVQTITGTAGTTPLPHATYSFEGSEGLTTKIVYERLVAHLNNVGPKYKLLVVKTEDWTSSIRWQP